MYEWFLGKRMSYLWELANDCFQGGPGLSGEVLLNSRGEGGVLDDELKSCKIRPGIITSNAIT